MFPPTSLNNFILQLSRKPTDPLFSLSICPKKLDHDRVRVRNEIVRTSARLGRAIWKVWSGYHRRSLVEAKMNCFKRLGERVMARNFERQVVELQIRAAILNRFTRLGTPTTVRVA